MRKIDSFLPLLRVKSSDTVNLFLGANGLLIQNTDILPTLIQDSRKHRVYGAFGINCCSFEFRVEYPLL